MASAEHYFSEEPRVASSPVATTIHAWGTTMRLETDAGVFSRGRLDPGTAVLFAKTRPPTGPGRYLDLGCGYGVIACALALANAEATVWATDVNRRAVRLTTANATALGVAERVTAATPDDADHPIPCGFDEIWSNPPIHVGKPAMHEILSRWLPTLVPGGTATLVVGRHLGADSLQTWMTDQGYPCGRLASAKGFRVLRATRPA